MASLRCKQNKLSMDRASHVLFLSLDGRIIIQLIGKLYIKVLQHIMTLHSQQVQVQSTGTPLMQETSYLNTPYHGKD